MIGEKMMDQKAFIESIDSTIDRLKKEIRFYNRVIGIGNIIKIVLSASIPILIDQASEHRSLLLIVSIASAIITGMATLFLTKIIRCCECCGVMAPIALDNEHPRI